MTHTREDFLLDTVHYELLNQAVMDASEDLQKFPRGAMRLTPDDVKATADWQKAKAAYDKANTSCRWFAAIYVKKYKKELAAERLERRAGGIGTDQRGVK